MIIFRMIINVIFTGSDSSGGSSRTSSGSIIFDSLAPSVTEWCHACLRKFITSSSKACQACR